jgi:nitrite reductase (NO-forming)
MLKNRISGRRHIPAAALALTLLGAGALLASAQTTTPTASVCAAGTTGPCVAIGQYDIYFKPNLATIPADEAVKVELTNNGVTEHNFSVTDHGNSGLENLNIAVNAQPGAKSEATINAPAGVYYFFCDIPGHEAAGMRGYITVKADASITTSEATVTPRAG